MSENTSDSNIAASATEDEALEVPRWLIAVIAGVTVVSAVIIGWSLDAMLSTQNLWLMPVVIVASTTYILFGGVIVNFGARKVQEFFDRKRGIGSEVEQ